MKEKIKNKNRKLIVESYQKQVQIAINEIMSRDGKLDSKTKDYLKTLEENIRRAPYTLGYFEWPVIKLKN